MKKKVKDADSKAAPVTKEHAKIRMWAQKLSHLYAHHPEVSELLEIASALTRIGSGEGAAEVLGIRLTPGHDETKEVARYKANQALTWIAGAMNADDEIGMGLGLSLTAACDKAEEYF